MKTFIQTKKTVIAIAAALAALATQAQAMAAGDWTFENAHLGDGFRTFVSRVHFTPPCDGDPINDDTRTVVFFPAKTCKGSAFPEKTTVILFTAAPLTDANMEAEVNTVVWMGGTYFDSRSNFPLRIGASSAEAVRVLGPEQESGTARGKGVTLRVVRHPNSVFSLNVEGRTVGFIVGEMPTIEFEEDFGTSESGTREEWRAVAAGYFRFTLGAGGGGTPTEPGNPTEPSPTPTPEPSPAPPSDPAVDPAAADLINEFFRGLKITDNEIERFATVAPTLHASLLRKDGRDFAPGIREYAYRRACQHVGWYAHPIDVDHVDEGRPTVIGAGPTAERGRVDKIFVKGGGEYATKAPAPIHVFYPANGDAPSILNFGGL